MNDGEELLRIVARYYGITVEDLRSDTRVQNVAFPRQVACAVLRRAGWQLTRIGDLIGRDHSTVHHAVELVENRARCEWQTRESVEEIAREWGRGEDGALAHLRKAVEQVRATAHEGRVSLQELEREADALLNKIAQAEKAVA